MVESIWETRNASTAVVNGDFLSIFQSFLVNASVSQAVVIIIVEAISITNFGNSNSS